MKNKRLTRQTSAPCHKSIAMVSLHTFLLEDLQKGGEVNFEGSYIYSVCDLPESPPYAISLPTPPYELLQERGPCPELAYHWSQCGGKVVDATLENWLDMLSYLDEEGLCDSVKGGAAWLEKCDRVLGRAIDDGSLLDTTNYMAPYGASLSIVLFYPLLVDSPPEKPPRDRDIVGYKPISRPVRAFVPSVDALYSMMEDGFSRAVDGTDSESDS